MDVTQIRNQNLAFCQKELLLGYEMALGLFGELNRLVDTRNAIKMVVS